ncbi:S8 family serine peptidase [Arenicella xantha]|uniref:Carbohydrate-selective porin (OprB family) n=1 Tax=Arenicella xantha TaxID=644221 RepID=A0A395JNS6_9GAMM|nr:S8 family serine peptidase [Arenicella xantha]RBP53259.1 carbohydrate-selective porin (OprB family) [Arenicella xantha]
MLNNKPLRKTKLSQIIAASVGMLGVVVGNAHAQQIALLDSGVDPARNFNTAPGFNYYTNSDDTSDVSDREGEGHGTVSVRVASEAFSGDIVPFVVTDGDLTRSNEGQVRVARDNAISDILGRNSIRVVGFTWGTEGVSASAAPLMSDLSRAGKVIAILAGNEFAAQPNALSTSSFNLPGVIIVGATDTEGVLLATSNRAGTTAERYVAAIGLPNSEATNGGTSWATARISGIAGAVFLQNPDLTAQEVVDVILQSAEDRGAQGTDPVYGRGVILSAEQVLNNVIGPVVVPTEPVTPPTNSGGGGGGGGGAILLVGGALAGALLLSKKSKTKLEKTLVLDSYGRGFQVDLNDHIEINDGVLHMSEFFNSLENKSIGNQFAIPSINTDVAFAATALADPRVDFVEYFSTPGDRGIEDRYTNLSVAMSSKLSESLSLSAGYQVSPSLELGAVRDLDTHAQFGSSSFVSGQSFDSVLSGFSSQANTLSFRYAPSAANTSVKLGFVSIDESGLYKQQSLSTVLQGSYQFADMGGVSVKFGQLDELGSVLGGGAAGVLGVENSVTYALDISGNIKATNKVSLVANYGVGRTKVEASESSLLNDFSTLSSDWYSLGLVGNNVFRAKDQMGIAVSQPIKIRSGAVNYSVPDSRLINGDIGFNTERINLSDTNATERNIEAYYRTMINSKMELGGFVSYRQNPNHISDFGDDAIVMATVRWWQ